MTTALNTARGAAIGLAEVVPGISGGTIALIVGVYETLINGAGHILSAAKATVLRRPAAAREHWQQVQWSTILPIGIGMAAALVIGAKVFEPLLEQYPVQSRAIFAGLIAASLIVPIQMVGRWQLRHVAVAVVAALFAVALTGIPPGNITDPHPLVITAAAAVAICALVLPGISGSFLLLTFGLYQATLAAVNTRDFGYLGFFALGALLGLAVFVKVLQYLLAHHHRITLAIMTGLMVGSLRALWPWQTADRDLLAPQGDTPLVIVLVAVGAAIIVALLIIERRIAAKHSLPLAPEGHVRNP